MKRLPRLFVSLALAFFAQHLSYAQGYLTQTGNPSFSTQIPIENGFINVNNGELHIEIPLALTPQRGSLQLNERLVYDSRIWKILSSSGYSWTPTNVPNSMGGWRFVTGMETGTTSYYLGTADTESCPSGTGTMKRTPFAGFSWTDPAGTTHRFTGMTYQFTSALHSCLETGTTSLPNQPGTTGFAVDGSGYSMSVTNYTVMTVYDPSGNQVYPTPTDRNGNFYSKDASGNLVDTNGRTPVTVTTSGNQILYSVLGFGGTRQTYTVTTDTVTVYTNFGQSAVAEQAGNQFTVIKSIQLPNGSSYSFTYDTSVQFGGLHPIAYGELASVTLPSGGTINYNYTNFLDSFGNQNRWISTRTKDGGVTTFTPKTISTCSATAACAEQVTVTSPNSNDTIYTFSLDATNTADAGKSWETAIAAWKGSSASGGGGTLLKTVATAYTYSSGVLPFGPHYNLPATVTSTTTLNDVAQRSQVQTVLDTYTGSKPVSVKEWDYFPTSGSAPANPLQETDYSYWSSNIPSQVLTKDGAGNILSKTNYTYDIPAATAITGLTHHNDSSIGNGNLTKTTQLVNISGSTLDTAVATYDSAGAILSLANPSGTTTYHYDPLDTYVTNTSLPTPSSGVALSTSAQFDPSTGLPLSTTDLNGSKTVYVNYDSMGRSTEIDQQDSGGSVIGKTAYTYTANELSVHNYQSTSVYADTEILYDGFGRQSRAAVANGQGNNPWYQTDTCYDSSGRVGFQSTTYQGSGWGTPQVCSGAGNATTYDGLGRTATVTNADGVYQVTSTGRATKTSDVNGVQKITQMDAFGRLTRVCEVSSSVLQGVSPVPCGQDIAATGFVTQYAYSTDSSANQVTTITQGQQTRTFTVDSLGRTVAITEPERGTTTYSYAYNGTGLLVTRKRPRANFTDPSLLTTTTTQKDALGRITYIGYDDNLTSNKSFVYDVNNCCVALPGAANLKGRLVLTGSSVGTAQTNKAGFAYSYDPVGRVVNMSACGPQTCVGSLAISRLLSFSYDWAGNLTGETDSGTGAIIYARSLAGEATSIVNNSYNDSNNAHSLVTNIVNGPNGATSYSLGNGLSVFKTYDGLGRSNGQWVCNGVAAYGCAGSTTLYGSDVVMRGSQVLRTDDGILNKQLLAGYDEFNRIASTSVLVGSQTTQTYAYTYDRYGNRWTQNALQAGGTNFSQSFNPANNQFSSGYSYDAAGNLLGDGFHTYVYDAEGNLLQVDSGQTASYVYDALNRRVSTQTAAGTFEMVFDPYGRQVSTWNATDKTVTEGRITWDGKPIAFRYQNRTYFEHQDYLGTERMRSDPAGAVAATYVSLPWGDGYSATSAQPAANSNTLHFGMLEADSESSTQHAQYRQYSNIEGRWMSPDSYDGSYDFGNPQSFNRYPYVLNNPLSSVDPTGLDGTGSGVGGLGGCIGAAGSGGGDIPADVVCGITVLRDLFDLFGSHPQFQGSLKPRPGIWDEHGSYQPRRDIAGALGLPTSGGCEFGSCGSSFAGPGMEDHHVFAQEFADWFEAHGLGPLAKLTIPLARAAHRLRSGPGVHTNDGGNWNNVWRQWIEDNPNATPQQIIDQGRKMLIQFGVGTGDVLGDFFIMVNPCYVHPFASYCNTGASNGPA